MKFKTRKTKFTGSIVELYSPELMFLGESGQPYRGSVYVQYKNNGVVVDGISFKKYITSLRDATLLFEDIADTILQKFKEVIDTEIKVTVDLTARGGIQSRITAGDIDKFDYPIHKPLFFQI